MINWFWQGSKTIYWGERIVSTNDAGTTIYLHAKEWSCVSIQALLIFRYSRANRLGDDCNYKDSLSYLHIPREQDIPFCVKDNAGKDSGYIQHRNT